MILLLVLLLICRSYSYQVNRITTSINQNINTNKLIHSNSNSNRIKSYKLQSKPSEFSVYLEDLGIKKPSRKIDQFIDVLTNAFPVWVFVFSVLGFTYPNMFRWFNPYIKLALGMTMTAMGMTLSLDDFKQVDPKYITIGFLAQYTIMPFAAKFFSSLFSLSPDFSAGLILVGCAPGGTASNLVTLIAQSDVALSVLMTTFSTLAAFIMTPLMTSRLAGSFVQVKAYELVSSCLEVVLGPIFLGVGLNFKFPAFCKRVSRITPLLSVVLVAMICATVSASNSGIPMGSVGVQLMSAVGCLHLTGFGLGYLVAKYIAKSGERRARTISIETGMQNSALAVVLAQHFTNPLSCALPGAISATTHSVIGSTLAAFWRNNKPKD